MSQLNDAQRAGDKSASAPVRAVEYVRMSTEHQKYSTENQSDVIRRYATQRGFTIVRTYKDAGRSGLNIEGRSGLRQLIADIESGTADFSVVLVYDISRWGRFQDADESAFYEYRCRRAGVRVEYCAEQFDNDGSIGSDVQKVVKRRMAAEYSRELSVKVFAGQCRLIEMGYRQGGLAGFGLRRELRDEQGRPKGILAVGEKKSIQTDRVVLVPGPSEEIAIVRWIYRRFVEDRQSEDDIAKELNQHGVLTDLGRAWTKGTVHQILINEKYIGNNVWNHESFKLKQHRVNNDPSMWVRADSAFEAIVEAEMFDAARAIIEARSRHLSNDEMLELLRGVYEQTGVLSGLIIDESDNCPSSKAYQHRFGGLLKAYKLIGYAPERDYRYIQINRALRLRHPQVIAETISGIETAGGRVHRDELTDLLTINREFTASLTINRCFQTPAGALRWKLRLDRGLLPDLTIAVRMNEQNLRARDYLILPTFDMDAKVLRLGENNGIWLDAFRFDNLDPLFEMAERIPISEAA
ncbi:recombinase family protein [Roseibium algicola]|uniref:Recombinase family protein n=1 Tax=Roseibium algicola TaxID=2857014 RepID=A0ABM6I4S6_9HYPH|nr:recombinase family protein [Roseibium aggregatum]AQQ05389.1 recombinase family protein [Roseibium aggregatum]